jgi:hypothetical protein
VANVAVTAVKTIEYFFSTLAFSDVVKAAVTVANSDAAMSVNWSTILLLYHHRKLPMLRRADIPNEVSKISCALAGIISSSLGSVSDIAMVISIIKKSTPRPVRTRLDCTHWGTRTLLPPTPPLGPLLFYASVQHSSTRSENREGRDVAPQIDHHRIVEQRDLAHGLFPRDQKAPTLVAGPSGAPNCPNRLCLKTRMGLQVPHGNRAHECSSSHSDAR